MLTKNGGEIGDLSYEKEILNLKHKLSELGMKINFFYDVLTYDSLQKALERQPTILHIICHGSSELKPVKTGKTSKKKKKE